MEAVSTPSLPGALYRPARRLRRSPRHGLALKRLSDLNAALGQPCRWRRLRRKPGIRRFLLALTARTLCANRCDYRVGGVTGRWACACVLRYSASGVPVP